MFSSPPPLAPPTSEGNELPWLRLLRSERVGPQTFRKLIAEHQGDAEAALAALPEIARTAGIARWQPCPPGRAEAELAAGAKAGARPIFLDHPDYPPGLRMLDDAPVLLWACGDAGLAARPVLAIVGARNASSLGRRMARHLARGLGEAGQVIASGLARGIDAEAHDAALATGTIAVVAGGIDVVYPQENSALTARIADEGLLLSEMPPGTRPQPSHFPRRNRIVAGLAAAVVVVEAAAKSGSLGTARLAADYGRDVLVVPGHPFDGRAAGCNQLIRDGAGLVRGPDDVLATLSPRSMPVAPQPRAEPESPAARHDPDPSPAAQTATARHSDPAVCEADPAILRPRVLALLGPAPLAEDALLADIGTTPAALAALLTELELDGLIERHPGGLLTRAT
ncbi:MAG: DNA-processing protein DprA [Pseudomonadota bacterium]